MALLDANLTALNHPIRRSILQLALSSERSAGELADAFSVTRPAVSQHVRVLVAAGLLTERRERQQRLYRVDPVALAAFRREFDAFWTLGLRKLKAAAEGDRKRSARAARKRKKSG